MDKKVWTNALGVPEQVPELDRCLPCRFIKLMNFIIIAEQILPLLRTRQGSQKALYINRFQAHLEDDSR